MGTHPDATRSPCRWTTCRWKEETEALECSAALTARATAGTTVDSRLTVHGAGSFSQAHHARGGAEGLGAREGGGAVQPRPRFP